MTAALAVRTAPCARCGVIRYRSDKREEYTICGFCAAKEILHDSTWTTPKDSHSLDLLDSAVEFVAANTTAQIMSEMCITRDEVKELRRRTGVKDRLAA